MTSYPIPRTSRQGRLTSMLTAQCGAPLIVAVPPELVRLFGDWTAAAFVAQCSYLAERTTDPDGFFFHTHEAWHATLHLSPDQVRRCVRASQGVVVACRRGLPGRNAYCVDWGLLQTLLATLHPAESQEAVAGELDAQPGASPSPGRGQPQPLPARPAPPHSSIGRKNTSQDDVRRAPPVATADLSRLLSVWNTHRGLLPEATHLSTLRRRALATLVHDCGDVPTAAQVLADATQEAARDEFWAQKRFGLDTLLPKALGRAEAWRSRTTPQPPMFGIAPCPFSVGQRVWYRREQYNIEAITERYIDLYDELNGSARILRASDDIRALRAVEVGA